MTQKNNFLLAAAVLAIVCAGQANANSCPAGTSATLVSGKILNQMINPGSTLGIVHLQVGEKTKVKCGIVGSGNLGSDGTINFVHSLVCDDSISVTNPATGRTENVHSYVILNTTGTSALQACVPGNLEAGFYGSFREFSVPVSGGGMFRGAQGGRIVIDGTVNCARALDMKFRGEFCMAGQ